ncbi:efflux transporter outer membrane subunit [Nitrogeniibacter mangrovi]|uniref:Efflux transporter outer membrane subunit n=1 Tax=Nitrogeniibacter mangrovi TaxID=2016596 RepID=A0A6C1B2P0_9RHOO|nr:efflux transporter outer membrane subunit [Nitrogeniibacter mangrovi]QID17906.1 efflux transporter outer membrane subunit [Nitrogeniibacter mangrovi]
MKASKRRLMPLAAALLLVGCTTVPAIDPADLPLVPPAFKEGNAAWTQAPPAEDQPRGQWWKVFDDPVLDALEARAIERNNEIRIATARLAQARALVRATEADRAPQLGVDASVVRQGGTLARASGTDGTLGRVGATLAYEVDLFGRLAEASRAASLDADAQAALLQDARLLIQSNVAQSYLALRAVDAERALVRQSVDAYRDTLALTQRRYDAGDVGELEVARVQTELAANESQALALDRQRTALEHALAVLMGDATANFSLIEEDWRSDLPVIPAGVPSTVLTRRPDVAAAQRAMLAAQARVGVAKAAWFPSFSLTANGGYASPDLEDVFKWSARSWGIGALLSLPIFDGGRRDAAIENAAAQLDIALGTYRERVLVAFKDVDDQLAALRLLAAQAEAQARAVAAAKRATTLSDYRYRDGLVSQLDVLDARRSELANRRAALQVRAARFQATVALIRAIGGGWGALCDTPAPEAPAMSRSG